MVSSAILIACGTNDSAEFGLWHIADRAYHQLEYLKCQHPENVADLTYLTIPFKRQGKAPWIFINTVGSVDTHRSKTAYIALRKKHT